MLVNLTSGQQIAERVVVCDTFWTKLRGLMFRRALDPGVAYVFVGHGESRAEATIHMFFVFFPIAVLWLDAQWRVVDTTLARPFRPYYAPRAPAKYFCECAPSVLEQVQTGDEMAFEMAFEGDGKDVE